MTDSRAAARFLAAGPDASLAPRPSLKRGRASFSASSDDSPAHKSPHLDDPRGDDDVADGRSSPLRHQTALDITEWLRNYRMGRGVASPQPRPPGLEHGGYFGSFVAPDVQDDVAFFEAQGYLRAPPPPPEAERSRSQIFRRLNLPTAMREQNTELQRCVRLAIGLIDLPNMRALVNLVDDDSFETVADSNGPLPEPDRLTGRCSTALWGDELSGMDAHICAHQILIPTPLHLPDIAADWRFQCVRTRLELDSQRRRNPWAVDGGVGCYLGFPLVCSAYVLGTSDNPDSVETLGSLCMVSPDRHPGYVMAPDVLAAMNDVAGLIGRVVESIYVTQARRKDVDMRLSIDALWTPSKRTERSDSTGPTPSPDLITPPLATASGIDGQLRTRLVDRPRLGRPSSSAQLTSTAQTLDRERAITRARKNAVAGFDIAARLLATHMSASFVYFIDLRDVTIDSLADVALSARVLSAVETPGLDKTQAGLASASAGGLLQDIIRMHEGDGRIAFDAQTLSSMRSVFPGITALVGMPFLDAQRAPQFCLLVGADQTHTLLAAEELSYARVVGTVLVSRLSIDRLLDTSSAASAFVSQSSHDLRAPLAAALAQLELMQTACPEELIAPVMPYIQTAELCGIQLRDALDDVLELQRLSARRNFARQPPIETDLAELLTNVGRIALARRQRQASCGKAAAHMTSLRSADAPGEAGPLPELRIEVEDRPDWRVMANACSLKRICLALIDNAISFTDAGGHVHVRITLQLAGKDRAAMLHIAVADDGIGMSPEFLRDGLLKPFVRASAERGGAGLGLPITDGLVSRLGGTLHVQSTLAVGTTVTVELPIGLVASLQPCDRMRALDLRHSKRARRSNSTMSVTSNGPRPMARVSSTAPPSDPSQRKVRVLLVDDNAVALRLLTTLCGRHGVTWKSAENGQQAVDLYRAEPFDLVLSDLSMPLMDGLDAAIAIRDIEANEPARKRCRFIILSAAFEARDTLDGTVDAWLVKGSFRLSAIRDILDEAQRVVDESEGDMTGAV